MHHYVLIPLQGILHSALHNEYWRLIDPQGKPTGVLGWWPSRAVTFLENHDTGSTQVFAPPLYTFFVDHRLGNKPVFGGYFGPVLMIHAIWSTIEKIIIVWLLLPLRIIFMGVVSFPYFLRGRGLRDCMWGS